jgi:hypothetical protein
LIADRIGERTMPLADVVCRRRHQQVGHEIRARIKGRNW